MSQSRAVRTGFSAVMRQPSVFAAELAWRWAYGIACALLVSYAFLLVLKSIPVSDRDLFGLSGFIPGWQREAWQHIFQGTGPRIVRTVLVLLAGLSILWWTAASVGRAAVLDSLSPLRRGSSLPMLLGVNLARIVLGIATAGAAAGAMAFATSLAREGRSYNDGAIVMLVLPSLFIITFVWTSLSWYFNLLPFLALRTSRNAVSLLMETAGFSRRCARQLAWAGLVFGGLRYALLFALFFVGAGLVSATIKLPIAAVSILVLLYLIYSALNTFLQTARLAAYMRIAEWDAEQRQEQGAFSVASIPSGNAPLSSRA